MKKKINVYKKVVGELTSQLKEARAQDRVLALQNQAKEHERKVRGGGCVVALLNGGCMLLNVTECY